MKRLIAVSIIAVVTAVSSLAYFYGYKQVYRSVAAVESSADSTVNASNPTATLTTATKIASSTEIEDDLESIIAEYDDLTIGVSVADIDNDYTYEAGETETAFRAASTTKLLTAVYYLHQVELGKASLDTVISGSTAQNLIKRMLNQSDNAAWYTLNTYLGYSNVQAYGRSIGMSSYSSSYNAVTTNDYLKLLVQLQKGQLISTDNRDLLYSYMQDTDNDTLIPAALSTDVTVYHKWGTIAGNLHDVAIITSGGHVYAMVIYTNNEADTTSLAARQKAAIQKVTQSIMNDLL